MKPTRWKAKFDGHLRQDGLRSEVVFEDECTLQVPFYDQLPATQVTQEATELARRQTTEPFSVRRRMRVESAQPVSIQLAAIDRRNSLPLKTELVQELSAANQSVRGTIQVDEKNRDRLDNHI